jgi:hypothetical protein
MGHTIADLLSKNLWGVFDWWLDYNMKMRSMMAGAYTRPLLSST